MAGSLGAAAGAAAAPVGAGPAAMGAAAGLAAGGALAGAQAASASTASNNGSRPAPVQRAAVPGSHPRRCICILLALVCDVRRAGGASAPGASLQKNDETVLDIMSCDGLTAAPGSASRPCSLPSTARAVYSLY